jgi:hypothetical protein
MDMIKGATILSERFAPHARVDRPRADVDASALPVYQWCGVAPARSAAAAVPVARHDVGGKRRRFPAAAAAAGGLMLRLMPFRV